MGKGVNLTASSGKSPGVVELWAQLGGAGGTVGSVDFLSFQLNRRLFRYFCRKRQGPIYILRSPV